MRNLLFGLLSSAVLMTSCATASGGSSGRPNSVSAMENSQQTQTKDPHDYVRDPTIGTSPPEGPREKPLCHLQCAPKTHCDASGMIERCVRDEEQKP
jgi:hypothetical protein